MLKESIKFHQRWLLINIAITPITAIIYLLPGPGNFVLYWNLYRIYSHLQAVRGAKSLLWAMSLPQDAVLPNGEMIASQERIFSMQPNKDLDSIVNPELIVRHPIAKEPLSTLLSETFHLKADQVQLILKQRLNAIQKVLSFPPSQDH